MRRGGKLASKEPLTSDTRAAKSKVLKFCKLPDEKSSSILFASSCGNGEKETQPLFTSRSYFACQYSVSTYGLTASRALTARREKTLQQTRRPLLAACLGKFHQRRQLGLAKGFQGAATPLAPELRQGEEEQTRSAAAVPSRAQQLQRSRKQSWADEAFRYLNQTSLQLCAAGPTFRCKHVHRAKRREAQVRGKLHYS